MTAADLREWLDQLDDEDVVLVGADGQSLAALGAARGYRRRYDYIVLGTVEDAWEEITA